MYPNSSVLVPASGSSQSAHEDYDAVDEQNIALAPIDSTDSANASYHRAEIVNYWIREFARQHEAAGNAPYSEAEAITRINALLEDHRRVATSYERDVVRNISVQVCNRTLMATIKLPAPSTLQENQSPLIPYGVSMVLMLITMRMACLTVSGSTSVQVPSVCRIQLL